MQITMLWGWWYHNYFLFSPTAKLPHRCFATISWNIKCSTRVMKLFVVSISTKILILKSLEVRNTHGFTLNSDKFGTCFKKPKLGKYVSIVHSNWYWTSLRRRTFRKTPPLHLKDCLVFLHIKTQMNNFWTHKLQKKTGSSGHS